MSFEGKELVATVILDMNEFRVVRRVGGNYKYEPYFDIEVPEEGKYILADRLEDTFEKCNPRHQTMARVLYQLLVRLAYEHDTRPMPKKGNY